MLTSASCDYNDIITILVGPEEHTFRAHKDVICAKSRFFRAACSDRWREGREKVVRLPGARSKCIFQMYMDWSYTNELEIDTFISQEFKKRAMNVLVELYLLGDVLDDIIVRNKTLRALNTLACQNKIVPGPTSCRII
jgi:hypothetical protein